MKRVYDPDGLIIERVALNYDFIQQQNYTWIDNLITGSGKDLANKKHPNFKLPYVQDYLQQIGERKCEANVMVTTPNIARQLLRTAIEKYLGIDVNIQDKNTLEFEVDRLKKKWERSVDTAAKNHGDYLIAKAKLDQENESNEE